MADERVKGSGKMSEEKTYPLEEAVKAQTALRSMAGLTPEQFPIQAFVGMISDEVQSLRELGKSDEEIASAIRDHSSIEITAAQIGQFYASPAERGHRPE